MTDRTERHHGGRPHRLQVVAFVLTAVLVGLCVALAVLGWLESAA